MTNRRKWLGLVSWLALCYGVSAFGSLFLPGPWFDALDKPPWNPPSWVFGPVWTVLYALMAVAAWLVWMKHGWAGARLPLAIFLVQLALNAAWSPLFFGLQSPLLAFVDISLLWLALGVTLVLFGRLRPLAGGLLLPYLLWVTFAAALNLEIWRLNPEA